MSPAQASPAQASPAWIAAGRLLLVLTGILLAVSPWTEYLWDWDRFLHGGQDCEFGLLAIALAFGLVLVLSQTRRQGLALFLAFERLIGILFQSPPGPALLPALGVFCGRLERERSPGLRLAMRTLPLLI